jgi:hypothetical protein
MKKFASYYIFVGIILSIFVVGIFMIGYGVYLYRNAQKWAETYVEPLDVIRPETQKKPTKKKKKTRKKATQKMDASNVTSSQSVQVVEQEPGPYDELINNITYAGKLTSSSDIKIKFLEYRDSIQTSWSADNRSFNEAAVVKYEKSNYLILISRFNSLVIPASNVTSILQYHRPHSQVYGKGGTFYEGNTQGVLLKTEEGTVILTTRKVLLKKYYQIVEYLFTDNHVGKYKINVWTPSPFVSLPFLIFPVVNRWWQRRWNTRFEKGAKVSLHNFQTLCDKLIENNVEISMVVQGTEEAEAIGSEAQEHLIMKDSPMPEQGNEELYELFIQKYTRGRNYFILGLLTLIIFIGIFIMAYAFRDLWESQKYKKELQRRGVAV